jgi:Family of unknown function (DUF6288)/PA14 domain/Bacterial Ig-like domain (group 3)/YDG domain/Bacterial Ig domain/HEAT repeats
MKETTRPRAAFAAICLAAFSVFAPSAQAAPPDLTAAGAIAALKAGTLADANPGYGETYNLGATGLRGWIFLSSGWGNTHGADGTMSGESRQILVTVAEAPGNAVLAVDDVILGAMAANSGAVPNFSSDARKAFGAAITDAEKTGAGTLRVKRWRAGTTSDENIPMTILGDYTATAPYSCPKSTLILANARNKLVSQLLADPNFLAANWEGGINGLALLAGVAPGDPNYATVQTRLQTFARALAASPPATSDYSSVDTWSTSYLSLFLNEYYLRTVADGTPDAQVINGLNTYVLALAKAQSRYGTFGHAGSLLKADGSLHGTIPPYGPVNAAAIPANVAIVLGKKALLAAGQPIDPEIDPAIQRGSDFYAWYVNKGPIPYGEHEPFIAGHSSNGKDPMCAVLFGLQPDRTAETEYFSRMTTSSFVGREYGHTGQGFSYLWSAMGAHMGGPLAVAEYLKPVRWHQDLSRRTDGSFVYDGAEQYGGGSTSGGTYLGESSYYGMNSTAPYLLTLSLPLQRLYITGRNAIPANTLDSAKVANAVAAATCQLDAPGFTNSQLIAKLSEYDPVVRHYAAIELGKRAPSSGELTTLRSMVSNMGDANGRMGACQALGLLKDATALPSITQRLDKNVEPNSWVRAKAASAIREYPAATASAHRDTMLTAYTANATDPEVIVWDDPVQISNNYLSFALFENIAGYTINAPKNLLYPAVKTGLKQPDSYSRSGAANFCYNRLTLADVQALTLDILEVITTKSQADTMWHAEPQLHGIALLKKHNCAEGLPMALSMMDVREGWTHGSAGHLSQVLDNLATWGDSARWIIPFLNEDISTLQPVLNIVDYQPTVPKIESTIAAIDSAITSPGPVNYLLPLATPQVVTTIGAKAITLTGTSPRGAVTFTNVTAPAHGMLSGTAPNLTYTPNGGYTGPDHFTFQVVDSLTTSEPGTVAIIVGTAGTGLKGEYFNNADFTSLQLTRTDAQVNFDWGTNSPHASIGADTFSVRWSGVLLVPETGTYTFSTLNSDGVRLYLNGVPAINQFASQDTNWNDSTPIALTEGQLVDIQMDYYENTGSAVAKLKWTGPSFAGVNGAIIGSQWLFDGTGMNRAPYAFPQSLTILKNKPKAITLTGSADALTYSVVTSPTHGTLSGTAPNLTYTPFANYIGPDSFTFKTHNGTTDSAPATVSLDVIPANTFSVNFYVGPDWPYGGLTTDEQKANLYIYPGMSAGLSDWFTYGWRNFLVPWAPSGPLAPVTLTSNQGSAATFTFKNCRNGYTYNGPRTTLLGDGNGNMMDGHVNSTLDGPYLFDMEVTDIPFAVYDVIFYIGANKDQYGDGTGVIKFNGGADRAFKLQPGAFNGTFTEMVNATTPGNYLIFRGVTGSSFTTQTWGTGSNGFNHIGPCGFQIREAAVDGDTVTSLVSSPNGTAAYGDAVTFTATVGFSGAPVTGTVIFKDGSTVLGSSTLDAAGQASFTTSELALGNRSITATYEGNGTYTGSISPQLTYVMTPRPLTISGVTAGNKIYDGNAVAALSGGTFSGGVVGGETVTVVPGSGSFASANVGTWAVTATGYALGGTHAGNYLLAAQPIVPNASITPRPVHLSGTRPYDGTSTAAGLVVSNRVGGDDLTLSGTATLASKDVGTQGVVVNFATPARVQSAKGNTGVNAAATISVSMGAAPIAGNTMIAVIGTRGTSANIVSSITQTGVPAGTWVRAAQSNNTSMTTEIWYAPNIPAGAGTAITINQASFRSAAVVMEYSGILAVNPLDQIAPEISVGSSTAALTGSTLETTQANELWIGGIGFAHRTRTLGTILNSFTTVDNETSTNTASNSTNARVYALQRIVNSTGAASSGGTISSSTQWSGAIATFKAASTSGLSLTGTAAGNYTLTGLTGAVEITPKALTLTATPTITPKTYDGFASATLTGSALQAAEAAGTGTTSDGKPYTGDTVTMTLSGTFDTKDAGNNKAVTSTSALGGANAGNYTLTQPVGLTGNVTPKALTLTATPSVTPKTYDGLAAATLTGATLHAAEAPGTGTTSDGKPYTGDSVTMVLSGAFDTKDAGNNKAVTSASALDGANAGNYTLTQPSGLTGTILPTALTITADNQSKTYGQTVVFGSGSTGFGSSGLLEGETIGTVTLTCTGGDPAAAVAGSPYAITPGAATGGTFLPANYAIDYVPGLLTVHPADQTITFEPLGARTYGDAPFDLTSTTTSGLPVDYISSDPTVASIAGNTVTLLKAGSTTITASQPGDTNYNAAVPVPQTLTVDLAASVTTLSTSGSPSTYGEPVTLTASVEPASGSGTVQFHQNAVALGGPVPLIGGQAQLVTSSLAAGTHSITATYSGSTNYNGSTATAMNQTVDQATPTITTPPTATDITDGQTLASSTLDGGAASVPGTFAFTVPSTAPPVGTASHSVIFTPSDTTNYQATATNVSVTVHSALTPFESWASDPAHGLTAGINDDPLDDPDHDGFSNLLEFVLGGAPMVSSQVIQPTFTQNGGNRVFSYQRSHLSKSSTTQIVEYGDQLTGWTPLTIPQQSAGAVTITPGASSDLVEVIIPTPGDKCFVRLKVDF